MTKISLNEYETLMRQAADKMRVLQEQNRDLLAACEAVLDYHASTNCKGNCKLGALVERCITATQKARGTA